MSGFFKPRPNAIYCMSLQQKNHKLALSRSDASIEIWNLNNSPFIERRITPSLDNFSIEGLAWYNDKLFSVGLHGFLLEYNLLKLSVASKSIVTGEAAFCLDIHQTKKQIAIGTEQGYLNIFDITEDGALFNKFLDKQEGRILCLKFDSTGVYVVSGGLDAIRIWNVESGHALHKMTTGRSEANKPTIIWCLAIADDMTIISGDSRGKLSFWDGKVGAQIESYQSHRADILSLCLSEDQSNLYCSGVDSNIINFVKIQIKGGRDKWVRSIHKKIQDHDVRALVLKGDKLYSGGTDGYLALSYNHPKVLVQYPPIPPNQFVTLCRKARLIMFRYPKYLEIWSLGETEENMQQLSNVLQLKKDPKRLIILQRLIKSHTGEDTKEAIIFATMSDDGRWIAYGTPTGLRVFQFIYEDNEIPKLLRVDNIDDNKQMHLTGVFTPDNSQFITTLSEGGIEIYDICNGSLSILQRLECKEITDTITFLITSENGNYLVGADCSSNIVVWKRKQKSWYIYCKLPVYSCPPTAITLHPTSLDLLVTYADNRIMEYSIRNKAYTSLSKDLQHSLPENWSTRFYSIRNIFYSSATDHIILHDDNCMMVIDKYKSNPEEKRKTKNEGAKKKRIEHAADQVHRFRILRKYKHLVYMGLLSDEEIAVVEVNPLTLLEQLPPVLLRHKFGTK